MKRAALTALVPAAAIALAVCALLFFGMPADLADNAVPHQPPPAFPAAETNETQSEPDTRQTPAHDEAEPFDPPPAPPPPPDTSIADILEEAGDLSDPEARARAVEAIREREDARLKAARERAEELGLPTRIELPDGTVKEIYGFEGDTPLYRVTHNVNAAVSAAVDRVRDDPAAPLRGAGVTIGMWDGGTARATHQEFGDRMRLMDNASAITHATHVGGTLIAAGIDARALGMAPLATVDSYDWNNDKSQMTARAAAAPGEEGKLYISNHSYGFVAGWLRTGQSSPRFEWHGGGGSVETRFGAYHAQARDSDAIAHAAPYYLMFRSAGNDRTENPADGDSVALSPGGTVVTYDSSVHPPGDGVYRGGYDTISFDAVAKNVITVGAVDDAVAAGQRDLSRASMAPFSSWGPTDDGRIKPDIVANGVTLVSASAGSNTGYATLSGTSMSAPNAAGAAALLIELYGTLFPGGAMRSSTVKGLLIHTADALGNPGPDYRFGWGLLNTEAAAALIRDFAENPATRRMTEDTLTTGDPAHTHSFVWDGASPLRATLAWTDPAGSATTSHDLRSPRLRNNLHLRVEGPGGEVFYPYVMPFVGTWTQESMSLPATTGVNNTDNVNQVYIAAPPSPGVYTAVVSRSGTLVNDRQVYSLLISGSAAEEPPPPALRVDAVSPASALSGETVTLRIEGTGFTEGTAVRLARAGLPDIPGTAYEVLGTGARAQFDLDGAVAGPWDLVAGRDDGSTDALAAAFSVTDAVWSENFDGAVEGWTTESPVGANAWSLTTDRSHSPDTSYFAPGVAQRSLAVLVSPPIEIPADASNLQLRFWQRRSLHSSRQGGIMELSVNGGPWTDIADPASGASFLSNGYNGTVSDIGRPADRNPLDDKAAWTGSTSAFVETIIGLQDTFAGATVRFRWSLGTSTRSSSEGWWIDSLALLGDSDEITGTPPVITAGPDATVSFFDTENERGVIEGVSTDLSVEAESAATNGTPLVYAWSAEGPPDAPVDFSENNNAAAAATTAVFAAAGIHTFTVTVTDGNGLTTAASLEVEVRAVPGGLSVSPAAATVTVGAARTFTATVHDQFGAPLESQPDSFTWSASGGGTIDSAGTFTADTVGDLFSIQAGSGDLSGTAAVTVAPLSAAVTLGNLVQTFDGTPKSVTVTTDPPGLATRVTYDGSEDPPAAVGSYAVRAEVTDPDYRGDAEGTLVIEPADDDGTSATLEDFLTRYFPDADPVSIDLTADLNGNGLPALADLAFGNHPAEHNLPVFRPDVELTTPGDVVLTFPRSREAENVLTLTAERSENLFTWHVLDPGTEGVVREVVEGGFRTTSETDGETAPTVDAVRYTVPADGHAALFFRLRVRPAEGG
ncbi:MAG: S8 family serine peptidase [Opitutales bacterium]|nr:S8 family serine peptidase [Opitutales bacterium]